MKKELLIGCGSNRDKRMRLLNDANPGWDNLTTLDINKHHNPDVLWDLLKMPLPFPRNEFDEIHAYEVLEHTGAQGDYRFFFEQFNEFYALLKPGGLFFATVPSRHSAWAWGDPSHTRIIQPESLVFLQQPLYTKGVGVTPMSDFRDIYKSDFDVVHQIDLGETFEFVLKAVKPSRITK